MDIAKKLQEYDEAFDFYLDNGYMPTTIERDDLLGTFIEQTIIANPQLDSQDPIWKELLKEELMKFIEAMLKLFQPLEEQYKKEKDLIYVFTNGGIEEKRNVWEQAELIIKRDYTKDEVNISGYSELVNQYNCEAVLASFVRDWDKACDEKFFREKEATINRHKNEWLKYIQEHGMADFEERKRIEDFLYSYPTLAEIVRMLGREQLKQKEVEMEETVKKYLPILFSPPKPAIEIEEITIGQSLCHMMPLEIAIMSDNQTEDLFYLKYITQKLQLFAYKPKEENIVKHDKTKHVKPRLEKGPIIVSLDTSSSMSGHPIKLAKCLLLQLLRMAKKQKRKCFLITFSVQANYLDLSQYGAWSQLNKYLNINFSGTDGEEMLNVALKMLKTANFAMADVLIISDFYFEKPKPETRNKMKAEHDNGTRFYGLQIGSSSNSYNNILDKIWKIEID